MMKQEMSEMVEGWSEDIVIDRRGETAIGSEMERKIDHRGVIRSETKIMAGIETVNHGRKQTTTAREIVSHNERQTAIGRERDIRKATVKVTVINRLAQKHQRKRMQNRRKTSPRKKRSPNLRYQPNR